MRLLRGIRAYFIGPEKEKFRCPCCRCRTLDSRGDYQICKVCFWEDDGYDDTPEDEPHTECIGDFRLSGPNGLLSIKQARENYLKFGAVEERLSPYVRTPSKHEME